jgi:hypothetical protein
MPGQSRNPRLNRLLQYVIILLKLNTFCNSSDAPWRAAKHRPPRIVLIFVVLLCIDD